MRPPVMSERDAFRQTAGAAVAIIVAILVGVVAGTIAGVVVAVAALAVAVVAYLVVGGRDRRPALREAASAPHPHGAPPGVRHVLVVANEPLSGTALRERIGEGRVEVDVLAPVLTSRLHFGVTDVDREFAQARARLETSLAWPAATASTRAGASAIRARRPRSRTSCATSAPTRSSSSRAAPATRPARSARSSSVCAASSTCPLPTSPPAERPRPMPAPASLLLAIDIGGSGVRRGFAQSQRKSHSAGTPAVTA